MKKIPVDTIENNMILAGDICGPSGNVLLGKGTKLSATIGRRLKNWGISFVEIEGQEEQKKEEPIDEESQEEFGKTLRIKFADVMQNPIMKEIFNAIIEFKNNKKN
jgi:hypothetical protein